MTNLGAIGDNLIPALGGGNASGQHDQLFNSQALEAAYRKLPLPKDSERPRSYIPRNPAATPSSYPQAQAPIVDNPALWERLDTDVLFFAFYYQQVWSTPSISVGYCAHFEACVSKHNVFCHRCIASSYMSILYTTYASCLKLHMELF
jgi:hypothetical protein